MVTLCNCMDNEYWTNIFYHNIKCDVRLLLAHIGYKSDNFTKLNCSNDEIPGILDRLSLAYNQGCIVSTFSRPTGNRYKFYCLKGEIFAMIKIGKVQSVVNAWIITDSKWSFLFVLYECLQTLLFNSAMYLNI